MKLMYYAIYFCYLAWIHKTHNLTLIELSATVLPDQLSSWWDSGVSWQPTSTEQIKIYIYQILNFGKPLKLAAPSTEALSAEPSRVPLFVASKHSGSNAYGIFLQAPSFPYTQLSALEQETHMLSVCERESTLYSSWNSFLKERLLPDL